jgi:MFS family permease
MNNLNSPKQETSRPTTLPRNPLRGFIYGTVWLGIALSMGAVLIHFISNDTGSQLFETSGQRTGGFITFVPFIALVASIFCLVRGGLAIPPYRAYLRSTTPEQRRQHQKEAWKNQGPPVSLMAIFTILAYVGFFALLIAVAVNYSTITASMNGTSTFVAIIMLVGLLTAFFTELLVKIIRSKS